MNYSTYLAFENAIEAGKYYEKTYGAKFEDQKPLTPEFAKQFNVETKDLSKTTFSAVLKIFETTFQISDRLENKGEFSDCVNLLIDFTPEEIDKYEVIKKQAENDNDKNYWNFITRMSNMI